MTSVDFPPRSQSASASFMTSELVIGTKTTFSLYLKRGVLVPISKTMWQEKIGIRDFGADNAIVPTTSVHATSIYRIIEKTTGIPSHYKNDLLWNKSFLQQVAKCNRETAAYNDI